MTPLSYCLAPDHSTPSRSQSRRLWIALSFFCVLSSAASGETTLRVDREQGALRDGNITYQLDGSTLPPADGVCLNQGQAWGCGAAAWDALERYLQEFSVECRPLIAIQSSENASLSAQCSISGSSLNAQLIREGWALTDNRVGAIYLEEEAAAQKAQLGIWRGGFEPPDTWRASSKENCSVCALRHQSLIDSRDKRKKASGASSND
ncbi:MAG: thermonuclease family protein [Arenicellales bacterium]